MGWRGKLFFLLFFYIAGFATAIYCLAPVSQEQKEYYSQKGFPYTAIKSDQFAKSCGNNLNKCINFVKNVSFKTVQEIKSQTAAKPTAQKPVLAGNFK